MTAGSENSPLLHLTMTEEAEGAKRRDSNALRFAGARETKDERGEEKNINSAYLVSFFSPHAQEKALRANTASCGALFSGYTARLLRLPIGGGKRGLGFAKPPGAPAHRAPHRAGFLHPCYALS